MSSTGETTLTAGQATAAGLTVNHEATASSAHSSREENKSKVGFVSPVNTEHFYLITL